MPAAAGHKDGGPLAGRARYQEPQGLLSTSTPLHSPVEGRAIKAGELLMLDGEDNCMKIWSVLLFANGFYAVPRSGGGAVQSFAWSPFSEVREDAFCPFGDLPAFAVYIFAHNMGFIFATWGDEAEEQRRQWVAALSYSLNFFTRSLFPTFSIAVSPLPHVPRTSTRLLAGYLLRFDGTGGAVSAPYCELHAHCKGSALLALYANERCEHFLDSIQVTPATPVFDSGGGGICNSFQLEKYQLCARSPEEKQCWLRALHNVKVKLMNDAPDANGEDLLNFREAVLEAAAIVERQLRLPPATPSEAPRRTDGVQRGGGGGGDLGGARRRCRSPPAHSGDLPLSPAIVAPDRGDDEYVPYDQVPGTSPELSHVSGGSRSHSSSSAAQATPVPAETCQNEVVLSDTRAATQATPVPSQRCQNEAAARVRGLVDSTPNKAAGLLGLLAPTPCRSSAPYDCEGRASRDDMAEPRPDSFSCSPAGPGLDQDVPPLLRSECGGPPPTAAVWPPARHCPGTPSRAEALKSPPLRDLNDGMPEWDAKLHGHLGDSRPPEPVQPRWQDPVDMMAVQELEELRSSPARPRSSSQSWSNDLAQPSCQDPIDATALQDLSGFSDYSI